MRGELKLDDQFTQAALQTAFRQRFSLIHIASHFSFEPGNDTNSFLMLGDGAHLTLARLKTFPPSNSFDLLTLSACNTGLNEGNTEGKEVDGLGVLAQRKGAQAVLASLWEVSDESTSLLMQRFYTLREAHPEATKGGALRDAQLEMLRGGIKPSDRATTGPRGVSRLWKPEAPTAGAVAFERDEKAPFAHPYLLGAVFLDWKLSPFANSPNTGSTSGMCRYNSRKR